jgi:hypothetical protein
MLSDKSKILALMKLSDTLRDHQISIFLELFQVPNEYHNNFDLLIVALGVIATFGG